MRKIWIGLALVCLGIGIWGEWSDYMGQGITDETGAVAFIMALLALFFFFLAWLWRQKSGRQKAGEGREEEA